MGAGIGLLISLLTTVCSGQVYFEYSSEIREIYSQLIDLKLDAAEERLQDYMHEAPENVAAVHMESYLDFFRLFISEDEALFEGFKERKNKRLERLEALPEHLPSRRFALAETKLQSALIRAKFDQVIGASRELYSAYRLLKKNEDEFPEFIYNKKSLSIIHSLVETVSLPGVVKTVFGIEGSLERGLEEIEALVAYSHATPDFPFKEEVDAIYVYILQYQANLPAEATSYLARARFNPIQSPLSTFILAKTNMRAGDNEAALALLQHRPRGEGYAAFPYLDMMEGVCLLRKGDPRARALLTRFLTKFSGRHYIKEAYQKLAWAALIHDGDIPAYKQYMGKVEREGYAVVDGDKQALQESTGHAIPDPILLRARLLYDGGYHTKALSLLTREAYRYAEDEQLELEFVYRMGRIYHALGNYVEAISWYAKVMEADVTGRHYFACNAALQSGIIYESQHNLRAARRLYESCLEMKPSAYKSSLHQKAKSGLQRIQSEGS